LALVFWGFSVVAQGAAQPGNPALGQCYPTARLIQRLDPRMEIVRGTVRAADSFHTHFWNALQVAEGSLWQLI
jgi:allophanate hydrolase subunit 1